MKKPACILTILMIAALLLLTACKQEEIPKQKPEPVQEPQTGMKGSQETGQEPEPQAAVPADTYKINTADSADNFVMKYKIDPNNKWKVQTANFEIRNFGDEPITPKITFMVGVGSSPVIKTFEYDPVPPGYKMLKQETVDMDVEEEHVFVKGILTDSETGREIDSVNFDYFVG